MAENPFDGAATQKILLAERDGTLPGPQAEALAGLRKTGAFPPPIPVRAGGADAALTVGGPRPAEAATLPQEAPAPSLASRAATGVARAAGQAVLPTVGGLVGAAAGGLIASPTVAGIPAGVIGGEMVGSAAGEKLNQMLGITEPSNAQVALAAAGGPAGRVIGGAVRAGYRGLITRLPGAAGGLSEIGEASAKGLPAIIRPKVSVDDLYAKVAQYNPAIKVPNLRAAADELLKSEAKVGELIPALKSSTIGGTAASVKSATADKSTETVSPILDAFGREIKIILDKPGGEGSFQAVRASLKRLGDRIDSLGRTGGEEYGAAKYLYKALQKDLEEAAGSSALGDTVRTALKTANAAARKNFAATELSEVIEKQGLSTVQSGDGMLVQVHPAKIANWIRKDDYFRKSVDPGELDKIHAVLTDLAKIPKPPPQRGVTYGAGMALTRIATGGSAAAAYSGGDPVITAIGTGISAYAPVIISRAMMSDRGRALLVSAIKSNRGFLDHKVLANLAQIVRTEGTAARNALRDDEP